VSPLAGFEVTTYGRIWGDRRGDTYLDLANRAGTILIETDADRLSVVGLRQNVRYGVISALPAIAGRASLR